jgi:hypothetical protein
MVNSDVGEVCQELVALLGSPQTIPSPEA